MNAEAFSVDDVAPSEARDRDSRAPTPQRLPRPSLPVFPDHGWGGGCFRTSIHSEINLASEGAVSMARMGPAESCCWVQ